MKKHINQQLVKTEKPEEEKQGKKRRIVIAQETYSSPVCYAHIKEEMRAEFRDE